ncbi:MAG: hypothetical protein QOK05_890 [Chloroflexota bacterium]|jgi:hypothetical protein|nr:hypothetical protein [Chloroflexota bacterium]
MIQTEELNYGAPRPRPKVRVIQGGRELDLELFSETLAMLESYVDDVLATNELPAMDPWVDDQAMDVRLASL